MKICTLACSVPAIVSALATASAAYAVDVRVATYNLSLNRNAPGQLYGDLTNSADIADSSFLVSNPANRSTIQQRRQQAATVAEIIKTARPDILLLNEFDYDQTPGRANATLDAFADNFLAVQRSDIPNRSANTPAPGLNAPGITYQYRFTAPTNTGLASGFDLDNNGVVGTTELTAPYGNDAYGFGEYAGRFGMAFLSKYRILTDEVRTFQNFLWKDMPGARLPDDPSTPAPNDFYSADELAVFRLSSKSHWDIPVDIDGQIVHILASHPTPPVFDGPEDRNGTRNADEIRFWADYISGQADYAYDDQGRYGGLDPNALFIILGDQNNDPNDGDGIRTQIQQLLANPNVENSAACTPTAPGGAENAGQGGPTGANARHVGPARNDTADFADGPTSSGNLRADYVLPARARPGFQCLDAGIFWPASTDPTSPLVGQFGFQPSSLGNGFPSSDHKLTFVDLAVVPEPGMLSLFAPGLAALLLRRRRRG